MCMMNLCRRGVLLALCVCVCVLYTWQPKAGAARLCMWLIYALQAQLAAAYGVITTPKALKMAAEGCSKAALGGFIGY